VFGVTNEVEEKKGQSKRSLYAGGLLFSTWAVVPLLSTSIHSAFLGQGFTVTLHLHFRGE
jgi:hypothetical protein